MKFVFLHSYFKVSFSFTEWDLCGFFYLTFKLKFAYNVYKKQIISLVNVLIQLVLTMTCVKLMLMENLFDM